jgi:monovalent cation:H+ antiporter-2, CPA2 family
MARGLGMMPRERHNIIVGAAIVSIAVNPFLFRRILALESTLARWPWLARRLAASSGARGAQANAAAAARREDPGAIVVGYGPVGRTVTRLLSEFGINPMIIETNIDAVLEIQQRGGLALFGDATKPDILEAAGIGSAAYCIVTIPKSDVSLRVIQRARELAPMARVLARAEYIAHAEAFVAAGAAITRYDEAESAAALAEALLQDIDIPAEQIEPLVNRIRRELVTLAKAPA